jgi:hypothetical protein
MLKTNIRSISEHKGVKEVLEIKVNFCVLMVSETKIEGELKHRRDKQIWSKVDKPGWQVKYAAVGLANNLSGDPSCCVTCVAISGREIG